MVPSADLAAALRPIRMPVPTEAEALADGLLAFALGLLAALLLYAIVRLILARRHDLRAALRAELAGSRRLDPPARMLVQARVAGRLRETAATDVRARLSEALYRPAPGLDLDATELALARVLAGERRGA